MNISISSGAWAQVPVSSLVSVYHRKGSIIAYAVSVLEPAGFDDDTVIIGKTSHPAESIDIRKPVAGSVWAYAVKDDCSLSAIESASQQVSLSDISKRTLTEPFGRLATASPKTLFDGKMTYGVPETYDQLAENGATITPAPNVSGALMSVTAQAGSRALLQMAEYAQYQAGNGHEANVTYGDLLDLNGACEFRSGYNDDENGIFLSYLGGSVRAVLRSSVTGTPVDQVVAQEDWNIDKLDGSGPSGITLDKIARAIFVPDLEWLSVGTVQLSFTINRQKVPFHAFDHANISPGDAYMTTADLPVRWELIGDGLNASSVVAECCSVKSYGGEETPTGFPFSQSSDWIGIGVTPVLMLALRPSATFAGKDNHVQFSFKDSPVLSSTESLQVEVIYNPDIAGASWAPVDADSGMEFTTVGTVTGGRNTQTLLTPSGGGGQGRGAASGALSTKLPFTVHLDGSQDVIALVGYAADGAGTGNGKIAVNWEEVR